MFNSFVQAKDGAEVGLRIATEQRWYPSGELSFAGS